MFKSYLLTTKAQEKCPYLRSSFTKLGISCYYAAIIVDYGYRKLWILHNKSLTVNWLVQSLLSIFRNYNICINKP